MKKLILILFFNLFLFALPTSAQITKVVNNLLSSVQEQEEMSEQKADSVGLVKDNSAETIADLKMQLMQMQLNEIKLRSEMDKNSKEEVKADDNNDYELQKKRIDSLRIHTKGALLIVEKDTLFTIYAKLGGVSAADRVSDASKRILEQGKKRVNDADSIYCLNVEDDMIEIMCGEKVLFSVTDNDAIWENSTKEELSVKMMEIIQNKITRIRADYSTNQIIKRIALFLLVIVAQVLLFKLTAYIHRQVKKRIAQFADTKLRSVVVKDYEFLTKERQASMLLFVALLGKYAFTIIQLIITIPILFSIFPQTETLAQKIFSYIYMPIKYIFNSVVEYIPNVFIIIIIYLFINYIIKGLRYIAREIEGGKLRITGFYPDWAQPSFNILKFLLYVFMLAMIYPLLPGSNSEAFKGISVLVGLMVSLGSTAVIGNVIAGLVITYMRPFKIGDRIKLNDTIGNVIEKTPFVTRIRTPKNEVVTIPNSFILSSHTVNYSVSAQEYGLIIHSSVTIGYDAPWRIVHELLIDAAKSTPGVLQTPAPFVLETELSDFYPVYQINAYITDANLLAQIYSDLHQNIQDKFNAAGVEIMSPHYRANRDGNDSTIPTESHKASLQ